MSDAPYSLTSDALRMKVSSPSFRLSELTIGWPCTHFNAPSMASHREESIITGTCATSGSVPIILMNEESSRHVSSMASSMLMSSTCAPDSTCERAIAVASSKECSFISRRNFLLPATLHRSPTFRKLRSGETIRDSSPDKTISSFDDGIRLVGYLFAMSAIAAICDGVDPQHPPTILTSPSASIFSTLRLIDCGVSSYLPISLGSPALG